MYIFLYYQVLTTIFYNPTTHVPLASDVTRVVLVTYYRGGSTFLGEIFNQNPDVFYWFEPLAWNVYHRATKLLGLEQEDFYVMRNGTFRLVRHKYVSLRSLTS